ncbi:branched-chain amino acid ABC transporter permease [Thermodesulfobacteriota bacterium]
MYKRKCGLYDETYDQDNALVRTRYRWIMLALLFVLMFAVFPFFVAGKYMLDVAINIGITVIALIGLQILMGFAGQVSIGHAAFMALGAYTSASLSYHLGWSFWLTMPCGALLSGFVGLLVGLPSLRIVGFYISISTLAVHWIIMWCILHGGEITQGISGLECNEISLFGLVFDTEFKFYFLIMIFVVIIVFLTNNITRSKFGRAFYAVRDNDLAAEFIGISVFHMKLLAFILSSVYAGMAGAFLAHYQGIITVEQFTLHQSIWYLGMLIIGGPTITGAIMGAVFLRLLEQVVLYMAPMIGEISPLLAGSAVVSSMQIFFGAVIILFLIYEPRGLFHRWQIILNTFRLWPFKRQFGL